MMKKTLALLAGMSLLLAACKDSGSGPGSASNATGNPVVAVTASATGTAGSISLGKTSGVGGTMAAIDSMKIDSAIIVLKDIKFLAVVDTASVRDSSRCGFDDDFWYWHPRHWRDSVRTVLRFKGPFVVSLQDTTPVQVALDTIPPGNYTGIKFVVHRLSRWDVELDPQLPDSLIGYSIVVVGKTKFGDGSWKPFVYKANINEEFKVKGDFAVVAGDTLIPYALKFDLVSWFTAPDGRILDPNSWFDRIWIRFNIKASLKGRTIGGRDWNHDGWPDWFRHWR